MMLSNISIIGWLHTVACLIALVTGLYVLVAAKGTRRHRRMGWWYVGSMLVLNLSVFVIYRFDIAPGRPPHTGPGIFGLFHWFAVLALASTLVAVFAATRQRGSRGWSHAHAQAMLGSFYGLIGGFINEMFARVLPLRALALHLSPHATNITQTSLVGVVQGSAMLVWFAVAILFFAQVSRRHRRPDPGAFTIGHPLRYSGGAFSLCMGVGGIIGGFTGFLGWGFILGALTGAVLSARVARLVQPIWGVPNDRQQKIRRIALVVQIAIFMLLGSSGFFQAMPRAVTGEVTILIVGSYLLLLRGSHGPMMLWLGGSVLGWLGVGHLLHLPLPLLAIGDGLLKLVFGFVMIEPLLIAHQSASIARTSEGVAPDARRLASVTD
jgi:uncharacterized membrane protein